MYLNTVIKYNVFKYCPALIESQIDSNILQLLTLPGRKI